MRFLKTFGLILLIVLGVMLIVPLFFSSKVIVSESTHVNAMPANVFRQVNILRNWSDWSPFESEDPNMISTYEGPEMGVGATHIWKSVRMGDGQMTIAESQPYRYIRIELDFYDRGQAANEWQFEQNPDGTHVTWTMTFDKLGYPLGRILGIFMPGMMRSYLIDGLANLKKIAEEKAPPSETMEVAVESFAAIIIADTVPFRNFTEQMSQNFAQLYNHSRMAGVDLAGHPFAVFSQWDTAGYIHYAVGFQVYGELRESSQVQYKVFPACNAIMATLYGTYDGFEAVHTDIQLFMAEHGLVEAGYPWEVYVVGPNDDRRPNKMDH
jgi:effector-binding domain-containing protein